MKPVVAVALVAQVVLAAAGGILCIEQKWAIGVTLLFADLLVMLFYFKAASLTLGNPDILPGQSCVEVLLFGTLTVATCGLLPFNDVVWDSDIMQRFYPLFAGSCLFPIFLKGGRRGACLIFAIICAAWSIRVYLQCTTTNEYHENCYGSQCITFEGSCRRGNTAAGSAQMAVACILASYTCYVRDQHLIVLFGTFKALVIVAFGNLLTGDSRAGLQLFLAFVFLYVYLLWLRRRRSLPAGLAGCKFVRLGYLRQLAKEGKQVCRCQDLPPEAFGDPQKAYFLIVTSHRWLDRFTCDIATEEHPGGLRLTTMLDKLNSHFSLAGLRCGNIKASLIGGWDVLLFFDFMCLPQVGKDKDGMEALRTPEEDALFRQCLPNMGALYSFFPVLILNEVTKDHTPYEQSGWCFSEVVTATLGKQVDLYNPIYASNFDVKATSKDDEEAGSLPKEKKRASLNELSSAEKANEFMATFEDELATKIFFNEGDRDCVRHIVSDFLLKRRLMDSIVLGNASEVQTILSQLPPERLQNMLDQAMDQVLNRPLHLAVKNGHPEVVKLLTNYGADPKSCNLWGDQPTQRLGFPKMSKAAQICRSHAKQPHKSESEAVAAKVPTSHGGTPTTATIIGA